MNLDKIPVDKRERIVEAAIIEFSNNNYELASTNKIVENAGISKGLLFHYFGNKKQLYLYCVDICIEIYRQGFADNIGKLSSDIFERLSEWGIIKLEFFLKYPNEYQVLWRAIVSSPEHLKDEINNRVAKVSAEFTPALLDNIDTSKIKEGFEVSSLIEILTWIGEAYSKKYIEIFENKKLQPIEVFDKDLLMKDFYKYLDILKYGFYK